MEKQKNSEQQLTRTLLEAMKSKNFTVQKLSQATGVAENFLENLINEKYNKFPPAPYVRGYLVKIAKALELNGEELWKNYLEDSNLIRRSGEFDKPPHNKYASSTKNKRLSVFLIFVAVAVIIVGVTKVKWFSSEPDIILTNPATEMTVVNSPVFEVRGGVGSGERLIINNENVYTDNEGNFEKEILLLPGLNVIEFAVRRFPGQSWHFSKQIFYEEEIRSENETEDVLMPEPDPLDNNQF